VFVGIGGPFFVPLFAQKLNAFARRTTLMRVGNSTKGMRIKAVAVSENMAS